MTDEPIKPPDPGKGVRMLRDMEPQLFPPKYPDIHVQLTGQDGNAFAILGRCLAAMKEAGVPGLERNQFIEQATAGTYDDLLKTCMEWLDVG